MSFSSNSFHIRSLIFANEIRKSELFMLDNAIRNLFATMVKCGAGYSTFHQNPTIFFLFVEKFIQILYRIWVHFAIRLAVFFSSFFSLEILILWNDDVYRIRRVAFDIFFFLILLKMKWKKKSSILHKRNKSKVVYFVSIRHSEVLFSSWSHFFAITK